MLHTKKFDLISNLAIYLGIFMLCFPIKMINAQNPELIRLKTFYYDHLSYQYYSLKAGYGLQYFQNDSIYVLPLRSDSLVLDFGIWSDYQADELHPEYPIKTIIYDRHFNPLNFIESKYWVGIQAVGADNNKVYLKGINGLTTNFTNPSINWTHNQNEGSHFLLEYDLIQNQLYERLTYDYQTTLGEFLNGYYLPFPGYSNTTGLTTGYLIEKYNMVWNRDGIIRGGPLFYDTLSINDVPYFNATNQMSYMAMSYNTNDYSVSTHEVTPPATSVFNYRYFPSQDSGYYYRVGSFRGDEAVVNPGGDVLEGYPTDSSFVTYLSKENANGESQFMRRLYSFNNLKPDTIDGNAMGSILNFESLVEMEDKIYLSERLVFITYEFFGIDSLLFSDIFGTQKAYYEMIDNPALGLDSSLRYPFAKDLIYCLSDEGNPEIVLSSINDFASYPQYSDGEVTSYQHSHNPLLFKVGEKLAWTMSYSATTDTVIALVRKTAMVSDTTFLNLPQGKGSCVLWLDAELNLIDHWVIPFSTSDLLGVAICYIGEASTDTLVIQGYIAQNTVTGLNPFDYSEFVVYPSTTSFLAFFSVPSSGTNTLRAKRNIQVYPNPAKDEIRIVSLPYYEFKHYTIYNVSGQLVKKGNFSTGSKYQKISVAKMPPGVYVLDVYGTEMTAITKFIIY